MMAKLLKENIYFMWLSGSQTPDFRTINRFRSEHLKDIIYEVFFSIVDLLQEQGLVKLENYFVDGTKMEANANRYTFVWRKSTEKYDQKLDEKFRQIVAGIEKVIDEEGSEQDVLDIEEGLEQHPVTSQQIDKTVEELEKRLADEPKNKTFKKAAKKLKEDLLPRKQKYEKQNQTFQGRNSYSKTDPDATFMRDKDDHMRNGQLKPMYNIQQATENQFVIHYSLHQRPGDTKCLEPHLAKLEEHNRQSHKRIIADSTYGTEENYDLLKEKEVEAYVKYNTFEKEQTRAWAKDVGRVENLEYDEELDEFICAHNQRLTFQSESKKTSETGYVSVKRKYRFSGCAGCPFQSTCAKGKEEKTITVSLKNLKQRQNLRDLLSTEEGRSCMHSANAMWNRCLATSSIIEVFVVFSLEAFQKQPLNGVCFVLPIIC